MQPRLKEFVDMLNDAIVFESNKSVSVCNSNTAFPIAVYKFGIHKGLIEINIFKDKIKNNVTFYDDDDSEIDISTLISISKSDVIPALLFYIDLF